MGKQKSPKDVYSISLTLGDKTYTSKGGTAAEALQNLDRPQKIVGKGFFKMTHGEKKVEQMFMPIRLKRMFWSKNFQVIHANMLQRVMK